MSSKQTTPYTIPYTGAPGKQVADTFIPASSQEPGAVAQPAAPQDKESQQVYQRPSIAEMAASPEIGYSKGESKTMVSGSARIAATSDFNSASRRTSVVPATHTGPSYSFPNRFASASAGADGIAIIHPEHRGSGDIHSSQVREDKVQKTQGSQVCALDLSQVGCCWVDTHRVLLPLVRMEPRMTPASACGTPRPRTVAVAVMEVPRSRAGFRLLTRRMMSFAK